MLRKARMEDLETIRELLNENIRTTTSVYHLTEKDTAYMKQWFCDKMDAGLPVFVVEEEGILLGYATYGPYRPYEGFRQTVEHSLYVAKERQRQGVGRILLDALVGEARKGGYHAMVAYIDADNEASIALHGRSGFGVCGKLREVGCKFGQYLDVVIMEKLL